MTDARTPGQEKISERAEKAWAGFEAQRLELGFGEHGHLWAIDRDSFVLGYQFAEADLAPLEREVAEAHVCPACGETTIAEDTPRVAQLEEDLSSARRALAEKGAEINGIWEMIAAELRWPKDGPLPSEKNMIPALAGLLATIPDYQARVKQLTSTLAEAHTALGHIGLLTTKEEVWAYVTSEAFSTLLTPPPPASGAQG